LEKFKIIEKIKSLYDNGENIIQYLRGLENRNFNTIEDILISYDFQSGTYVKQFYSNQDYHERYCQCIGSVINQLGNFNSVMEAGVGEATTLGVMIKNLRKKPDFVFGFDLSWSRVNFANSFIKDQGLDNVTLFTSNLFEIALPDNAIDIVYTSHSIEPNGGREKEALSELYRVAKKYLILLEPSYTFGSAEARERMVKHGYVTNLYETAQVLGYNIIEHRLFDTYNNPLNPTGLLVIKKPEYPNQLDAPYLACPVTRGKLTDQDNVLYSEEGLLAYPIIKGIPCLLQQNAILASHFNLNYGKFKSELSR
jgi:uncharacterized protein YbaR (Trm112 family)